MTGSASTFVTAQHAAELALASMALRALFAREGIDTPDRQALRVTVTHDEAGLFVAEVEVLGPGGFPIAGYSL